LFWALYLLALDPVTQEEVAREASAVVVAGGVPDFSRLAFTRAVIDETLRLYPPAFLIVRAARGRDVVAGIAIAPGDILMVAPWVLHRHEKLWHDPNTFEPTRFLPNNPQPDKFAYLPFGVGPRVCIGAQFAITEATLVLAKLIGTFRVELLDRGPITPTGVVTTQPDRSPMFRITRR
jgi:unspecific monooxygenase